MEPGSVGDIRNAARSKYRPDMLFAVQIALSGELVRRWVVLLVSQAAVRIPVVEGPASYRGGSVWANSREPALMLGRLTAAPVALFILVIQKDTQ